MVVPDIAIVSIGVVSRGTTAREALDANSTDLAKVIDDHQGRGRRRDRHRHVRLLGQSGLRDAAGAAPSRRTSRRGSSATRSRTRCASPSAPSPPPAPSSTRSSPPAPTRSIRSPSTSPTGSSRPTRRSPTPSPKRAGRPRSWPRPPASAWSASSAYRRTMPSRSSPGRKCRMAAKSVPIMPGERQVSANATVSWEIAPE